MEKIKICHLTSAHKQDDVRIYLKECRSLAKIYDVHLIVVNGASKNIDGVEIHSVSVDYKTRIERFTKAVDAVYSKAVELNANVYHFHDPELLRVALRLKRKNVKVIYDSHEDLPRQLLSKPYLNSFFSKVLSNFFEFYENKIVKKLDGVITATPFIRDRFKKINNNVIDINNFPVLSELEVITDKKSDNLNKVCYIGGVSEIRGLKELVEAMDSVEKVKLDLAGKISDPFKVKLKSLRGWLKVNELGQISREDSMNVKKNSFAGIVTFLPMLNHINAQPNKIFEYMAAGLAVIGSNFPLWKEIIEENKVGICVDPTNSKEISDAINYLNQNQNIAIEMGERGKILISEKYNWGIEEQKLLQFYDNLLKK